MLHQQLAAAKEQLKRQRSNGSGSLPDSESPALGPSCVHMMHLKCIAMLHCYDLQHGGLPAWVAQLGMRRHPSLMMMKEARYSLTQGPLRFTFVMLISTLLACLIHTSS